MSQTTEVGECSWLHAYCATLTACLLLWGQMQREGDTGLQEEFEKASGKVFQAQGTVQRSTEMAIGQRHPSKPLKGQFLQASQKQKESLIQNERGLTPQACPPTSRLLLFASFFISLEF